MYFNDVPNETGVCQEIDDICGSTVNTFSLKKKARRTNLAIDRFYTIALKNDENFTYDDPNNTDLPIGVANLVSGQQDYSFASELLMLEKVFVADTNGIFQEIHEVLPGSTQEKNIFALPTGDSGVPTRFKVIGNSILLDPIPNYNGTGYLKVVFKRNGVKFLSTDTTNKELGVPSLFVGYICRQASLPFLIEKKLPQLQGVAAQIVTDEAEIADFMSNRNKTSPTQIRMKNRSSR